MTLEAAIFDLDGVITDTAKVHFAAWKELFDNYLKERAAQLNEEFQEFTELDYLQYVDGMPRYDGIQTFLKSRAAHIPKGKPNDDIDQETICGMANRKNQLFNQALTRDGVEIFHSTIERVKEFRSKGIKVAVVSSSKNCEAILKKSNIDDLFETRVDGVVSEELGLNGKPNPDIFLEATRRLGVEPKNALIVEDAISGVQAGKAGEFGLVIGIDRKGTLAEALKEGGAHIVINDLKEMSRKDMENWFQNGLPSVLENTDALTKQFSGKQVVLFLDYDGTLTPIVATPDLAVLSDEMRDSLKRTADCYTTALISGRELSNLLKMVAIDGLYYAGNHGFEIEGPHHSKIKTRKGEKYLEVVDKAYHDIKKRVGDIEGVIIEHKKFSLSVHIRLVDESLVDGIEKAVDEVLSHYTELKKHHGKKVFEVRPRMDWHKGKAVMHLLKALDLDKEDVLPIYIGDDVTDEDAFEALKDRGLGILVTDHPKASAANYMLKNSSEVQEFLEKLIQIKS